MSIRNNTFWNLFGTIVPLTFAFFSIPFIISNIGVERFGILTIIWTMIGYFSLFDLGLGRALTQRIAFYISIEKNADIEKVAFNGMLLTSLTGFVGGLVFAFLAYPLAYYFLNVSGNLLVETFQSLLITSIGIFFATISSSIRGILEAYQDFKRVNLVKFVIGVSNFLSPVISIIFFGDSIFYCAFIMVVVRFITTLFYFYFLSKRIFFLKFSGKFSRETIKDILPFGAWMSVSNIVGPIMVSFDRFFISNISGAYLVAFYTVPFEVFSKILLLPSALATSLFPRFSSNSENAIKSEASIYRRSFSVCFFVLFLICVFCLFFSDFFIKIWLGEEFLEKSSSVAKIIVVGVFFNGLAMMPYAYLQANNYVKLTAKIHVYELICYIPLLLSLTYFFSLEGAAIAWSLRAIIDFMLMEYYKSSIIK